MAQDQWTLQEKERVKNEPAHGPPLQAHVVAANRTVLTTLHGDPGAHGNDQGGKAKLNRTGKTMRRAVGMAWQRRAGTQPAEQGRCRRTQPADDLPGTGLEAKQPAVGRPRSTTTAADDVGRPLAVQCREVEGMRWCWHSRGGLRPT